MKHRRKAVIGTAHNETVFVRRRDFFSVFCPTFAGLGIFVPYAAAKFYGWSSDEAFWLMSNSVKGGAVLLVIFLCTVRFIPICRRGLYASFLAFILALFACWETLTYVDVSRQTRIVVEMSKKHDLRATAPVRSKFWDSQEKVHALQISEAATPEDVARAEAVTTENAAALEALNMDIQNEMGAWDAEDREHLVGDALTQAVSFNATARAEVAKGFAELKALTRAQHSGLMQGETPLARGDALLQAAYYSAMSTYTYAVNMRTQRENAR